jgi:hypothetical protein
MQRLYAAIDEAERFIASMPSEAVGSIYLKDGVPIQPDPSKLDDFVEHRPQRRGHWPSSQTISEAMLGYLKQLQTGRR